MSTAEVKEVKTFYTPEDLLVMADGDSYEFVDGQLVQTKMGTKASWVASEVLLISAPMANPIQRVGPCLKPAISASPKPPTRSVAPTCPSSALAACLTRNCRKATVRSPRIWRSKSLRRETPTMKWQKQDELLGEQVLPGFRCLVRDVFPPVTS